LRRLELLYLIILMFCFKVRINMQGLIAKDNVIDYIITGRNPLDAR
jgi:hypothetical protein